MYSAPRSDSFPAGLRVLVVDDDSTWLKILEKMLKKCLYEVTTCGLAREALNLLRDRKDGFDIVISDVNMPDMDGFKLLEHVGLEMDLPVIIMSVDGETSRVMKGVQHGACDYLLKPIQMKELRNIWQHVFRKRIHEVRDNESHDGLEDIQLMGNGSLYMEDKYFHCGTDLTSKRKRRDFENKHDDRQSNDPSSVKKPRVVWTIDLHQKFVQAVNQVGLEKVGPKKILDLMGVPWLTRENVASHLQKYRLYLSRLQKEKELTSFSRMKRPDVSPNEHERNHCLRNPTTQVLNDSTGGYCHTSRNGSTALDVKVLESDMECTVSNAKGEPKKLPKGDNPDTQKTSTPMMNFRHPFGQFDSEVKLVETIGKENSWNADSGFNLGTLPPFQQYIKVECLQSVSCTKSNPSQSDITTEEVNYARSTGQLSPDRSTIDVLSLLAGTELTCEHSVKPKTSTLSSIKSQTVEQIPVADLNSEQQGVYSWSMTASASMDAKGRVCSIGGDLQPLNIGFQNIESLYSSYPEHIAGPACFYDYPKLDYEYPLDSAEFSVIDNSLYL